MLVRLKGGYADGGILGGQKYPDWQSDYLNVMTHRDLPNWGMPARRGFVTVNMTWETQSQPRPIAIRNDLLRDLTCEICSRPYSVYAVALFCPDCGAPNLATHFQREIELVQGQLVLATEQEKVGKEAQAFRLMCNAHEDVVTAFETTLKLVYRYLVKKSNSGNTVDSEDGRMSGNEFQNIARSQKRFARLGIDLFGILSDESLKRMELNLEKRHVISHNLGIADERYASLTQSDQLGTSVSLIDDDIRHFASCCLTVITELEHHLLPN